MEGFLPRIWQEGLFDSKQRFGSLRRTKERRVNQYEIELFCGNSGCSFVNGEPHELRKGNLLIARPGDLRYSQLHFSCLYVHFEVYDPELDRFVKSLPQFVAEDLSDQLSGYFEQVHEYMKIKEPYAPVQAAAALLSLLCRIDELERERMKNALLSDEGNPVAKAVRYIHNHYSEHIGIEEMAEYAGFSASYLHKRFLEAVGVQPNRYLNNVRLTKAKELLEESDEPLSVIAERCGFASQPYFNYLFKKETGISPGKYRENVQTVVCG